MQLKKLLIGLLACMIYRIITLSFSLIYYQLYTPHKIHISTNLNDFYVYLLLVFCVFISTAISRQAIGITVGVGSTLLLGMDIFKDDLPCRALLFVFSAFLAYLFIFTSNNQLRKSQSGLHTSKAVRRLKYILLIVYPIYLFFEVGIFRNVSLFIACIISLSLFISWLNEKIH
ncbi:hypothetical protein EC843_101881 [Buttiauxella sp. JUb87]|nr:hypothetical protein EC843_101881 [Buttiauxella sp. JUb87]